MLTSGILCLRCVQAIAWGGGLGLTLYQLGNLKKRKERMKRLKSRRGRDRRRKLREQSLAMSTQHKSRCTLKIHILTLEASIVLALSFCCLTDYQKEGAKCPIFSYFFPPIFWKKFLFFPIFHQNSYFFLFFTKIPIFSYFSAVFSTFILIFSQKLNRGVRNKENQLLG